MGFNLVNSVRTARFQNLSTNWTSVTPMNNMLGFYMFVTMALIGCLVITVIAIP